MPMQCYFFLVTVVCFVAIKSRHVVAVFSSPSYPTLFLFGAPKCGTTALYRILMSHEAFCHPRSKEPSFFGFATFRNGEEYYNSFFNRTNTSRSACNITLDATPYFSYREKAIEHIKKSYSKSDLRTKKFILILRDPAKRLFSWYNMIVRLFAVQLKEEIRTMKPESLKDRVGLMYKGYKLSDKCTRYMKEWGCRDIPVNSVYAADPEKMFFSFETYYERQQLKSLTQLSYETQLIALFKTVPRKNTFIINFEFLIENTVEVMRNISVFLNISDIWATTTMISSE
jgi:hypothetical protein